ncbi:MAG: hypothetical protein JWP61_2295 [Friedmanniella sp.]|nr:hypothetical protein [Friedmanniella sp.]
MTGFWTSGADGVGSHTFIVLEHEAEAQRFAADVRGNRDDQRRAGAENISLVVDEVAAQARHQ